MASLPRRPWLPIINNYYKATPSHLLNIPKLSTNTQYIGISNFYHLQTLILHCITTNKFAHQLFIDAPCLLWLMLEHYGADESITRLEAKRVKIIEEILGAGNKKQVKIIRKIRPSSGYRDEIHTIKQALSDKRILDEFTHWRSIPAQALEIAKRHPILLGTKILKTLETEHNEHILKHSKSISNSVHTFIECIRIGKSIGFKSPESILGRVASVDRLSKIHDRWTQILNRQSKYLDEDEALPPCPLNETSTIVQIATINELIREGKTMEHCVGSYTQRALSRTCFIF
ncbi:PcfJ domain-containing protein [Pseudomonas lalucatii]|nr:PcfJ domain-containing protein [Pseudomonas lalucatii]